MQVLEANSNLGVNACFAGAILKVERRLGAYTGLKGNAGLGANFGFRSDANLGGKAGAHAGHGANSICRCVSEPCWSERQCWSGSQIEDLFLDASLGGKDGAMQALSQSTTLESTLVLE
ncbi:hypothetical protein NPIL_421991 [Nephila pilipes]|uniref:Uncharacterized protein n=1 Tax=Nephila pilipes TaxID=299642 RepID=A0A8X6MDR5_NEPPI|nr:hypothetical protein NPIL_421991 [Nephila pilipes]